MRVVHQPTTNPYFNLALEDYLLHQMDGDFFMLWRNVPAIIVGRNQNTLAEINYDYVRDNHIPVVRRQTGGGAVFHDLGNINYTFIEQDGEKNFNNYEVYSRPVVEVLNELGVPARLEGRNDLLIEGKKFSGNAQCAWHGRVLHHGTLMFSANVSDMTAALNVNDMKIQSKGIKSVRSRVTNISEYLKQPLTIDEFIRMLLDKILQTVPGAEPYRLTAEDNAAVQKLVDEKYDTWEWNFGFEKPYTFRKESLFPSGYFEVNLTIEDNRIQAARFFGDYFGKQDVGELETALMGQRYDPQALRAFLSEQDIAAYFSGMTPELLLTAMM